DLWFIDKQEEGVQAFGARLRGRIRAVKVRFRHALFMQLFDTFGSNLPQLLENAELNRVRWACFRAGGLHVEFHAVVAHGALPRATVFRPAVDHAEGTVDYTIAAAVANVRLHIDGVEFRANDCSR